MRNKINKYLSILCLLLSIPALCGCSNTRTEVGIFSTNSPTIQNISKLCEAVGCKSDTLDGYNCCEAHICQVKGCQNAAIVRWGGYCKEHVCSREDCRNPRMDGSDLCAAHNDLNQLCEAEGCTRLKTAGGKYCPTHEIGYTCNYWNCNNKSEENSYFCIEHQSKGCKYNGCHNPVESLSDYDNPEYCEYHGCHYPGCIVKSTYSGYCAYHWDFHLKEINSSLDKNNQKTSLNNDVLIVDESGKQIWKVCAKSSEFHFNASCSGSGYFGIKILDSNQDFYSLVMNEIGSYELDKSVYGLTQGEIYYIQIEFSRGTITYSWSGTYGH